VIHPRAGKADRQHERRADPGQRLFEIGAVLLGDLDKARVGKGVPSPDRVHVPYHNVWRNPRRDASIGPAVSGDDGGRKRHRIGKIRSL